MVIIDVLLKSELCLYCELCMNIPVVLLYFFIFELLVPDMLFDSVYVVLILFGLSLVNCFIFFTFIVVFFSILETND